MKPYHYPFSAIVGQEKMKTALLLNAVAPDIGGVLISGHKGTGKSTAVRALARILPEVEGVSDCPYHCPIDDSHVMCESCLERTANGETLPVSRRTMPVVELPLSATEDRVVGTLHVEQTLKTGTRRFEPGLMAAANRGILYVDEVNLLDDHLVDILLDAAASGVNIVEREGISHSHPARFILVGTMNPEEGDLRPQFLDRFGLRIAVGTLEDAGSRQSIARRRIAFDENPEALLEKWSVSESILMQQVVQARAALESIVLPEAMISLAVQLSTAMDVQGHRSDIVILKTARVLAALLEEKEVKKAHLAEAARYALPHRITHTQLASPGTILEKLEGALSKVLYDEAESGGVKAEEINDDCWDDISTQVPGHVAASNTDILFSFLEEKKKLYLTQMN